MLKIKLVQVAFLFSMVSFSVAGGPVDISLVGETDFRAAVQHPSAVSENGTVGFLFTRQRINENGPLHNFLLSIDITSGTTLEVLDSLDITALGGSGSEEIHVVGDRLYMVPWPSVIDISDPTQLAILGQFGTPDSIEDAAVVGTTIYARESGGIGIYDCSNPAKISFVGLVNVPGGGPVSSLTAFGSDKLIIGRSYNGMQVLDVSVVGLLPIIGAIQNDNLSQNLVIDGNRACALWYGTSEAKLTVLDLSEPTSPKIEGQAVLSGFRGWEYGGRLNFIGPDFLGIILDFESLEVVDISDSSNIVSAPSISVYTGNLARAGDDSVLISTENGVSLYRVNEQPDCAADLDGDGELNFFDVAEFLEAFAAMDAAADFTGDGDFDFFDVADFLEAYATGCP